MPKIFNSLSDKEHGKEGSEIKGIARRDFLKFCTITAASLGLPLSMGQAIADTITSKKRPPVIWVHFQECTGCTESLLRATHPTVEHLILDLISSTSAEPNLLTTFSAR